MFITDYLIPRLIAKRDLRANTGSYDSLLQQAFSYRNHLDAKFNKKEKEAIRRNLTPLKKQIAPLEIDHDRFERAVEERKSEIAQWAGVSAEAKAFKIQETDTAQTLVTERDGRKISLVIGEIKTRKKIICIKANKRIVKQNDRFRRLHAAFCYRLANYLWVLNKFAELQEVKIELTTEPKTLEQWDFNTQFSASPEL